MFTGTHIMRPIVLIVQRICSSYYSIISILIIKAACKEGHQYSAARFTSIIQDYLRFNIIGEKVNVEKEINIHSLSA